MNKHLIGKDEAVNRNEYRRANLSSKPNSPALLTKGCTKSANKPKHLLTIALDSPLNQPAKSIAPQAERAILSRLLCLHIRGINAIALRVRRPVHPCAQPFV